MSNRNGQRLVRLLVANEGVSWTSRAIRIQGIWECSKTEIAVSNRAALPINIAGVSA